MPRGQRRARTRDTRLRGACRSARPTIGPGGSTWSGGWSSAGAEAASQVRIPTIPNALAHAHDPTHRFSRKSVQAPRFLYSARGTWHPPLAWRAAAAARACIYSLFVLLKQLECVGATSDASRRVERRRRSLLVHAAERRPREGNRSCEEACTRLRDRARAWKGSIGTPASRHARTYAPCCTYRSVCGARPRSRRSCVPRTVGVSSAAKCMWCGRTSNVTASAANVFHIPYTSIKKSWVW